MDKIILCAVIIVVLVCMMIYGISYQKNERILEERRAKHQRFMLKQKARLADAEAAKAHECRLAAEAFREACAMLDKEPEVLG